ncbi:MAG TPA: VOC family protein [Chloroflexota bacterium]|nr:VOC family protein [Chloroflexota bacterium]
MAELESLSHSGICVGDLREAERFYEEVLGGQVINRVNFNTDDARRGRSVHSNLVLGDFLFALMLPKDEMPMPAEDEHRGTNGFRHGFAVSREQFDQIVGRLRDREIPFEGPINHPEAGPLGESVYFKDPGGNFLEVCWRRDEARPYNPVTIGEG